MTPSDPIVIVSAVRTPLGRFQGELSPLQASELGARAIRAALDRATVAPEKIDEVLFGNVLPAGQGQAPARQAARAAGLPDATGATTINKVCGSGMKATFLAHDLLSAGSADIMLAGGMESMSNAPYLLRRRASGYRAGHERVFDHMLLDGLEDAYERAVAWATSAKPLPRPTSSPAPIRTPCHRDSCTRARAAIQSGAFEAEIAPMTIAVKDGENIVAETRTR